MKDMKKLSKFISIMLSILLIISFASNVFAAPNPGNYTGNDSYDTSAIGKIGNQIIQIISTIGSIASVIVLVVIGIKYMMGSAEEKAEYKKTLMPYAIGAALVFAASAIAGVIYAFTNTLGNT